MLKKSVKSLLRNHAEPHWRPDVDLLDRESTHTTVKKFTGNFSCSIRVTSKITQRRRHANVLHLNKTFSLANNTGPLWSEMLGQEKGKEREGTLNLLIKTRHRKYFKRTRPVLSLSLERMNKRTKYLSRNKRNMEKWRDWRGDANRLSLSCAPFSARHQSGSPLD